MGIPVLDNTVYSMCSRPGVICSGLVGCADNPE